MKFESQAKILTGAFNRLAPFVGRGRIFAPVVWVEIHPESGIVVRGGDQERMAQTRIATALILDHGDGRAILPFDVLSQIVGKVAEMASSVQIEADETGISVVVKRDGIGIGGSWRLVTPGVQDAARLAALATRPPSVQEFDIAAGMLSRLADATSPYSNPDATRYALVGPLVELAAESDTVRFIGTDGRSLALAAGGLSGSARINRDLLGAIIPTPLLRSISRFLKDPQETIRITLDRIEAREFTGHSRIWFQGAGWEATGLLAEGRFPRWREIVGGEAPDFDGAAEVPTADLRQRLEQMNASIDRKVSRAAIFDHRDNELSITFVDESKSLVIAGKKLSDGKLFKRSETTVPNCSGPDQGRFLLDPQYVLRGLRAFDDIVDPTVRFRVIGPKQPVIFGKPGDDFWFLVSPITEDRKGTK